jgi:hypothetical protein
MFLSPAMINIGRIVKGCFMVSCLLLWAVSKADAPDSILVSESASWAWFGSSVNNGSIEVLLAGANIVKPEVFAVQPDEYKVLRETNSTEPIGTSQAKRETKQQWLNSSPFWGHAVELFRYKYSTELEKFILSIKGQKRVVLEEDQMADWAKRNRLASDASH